MKEYDSGVWRRGRATSEQKEAAGTTEPNRPHPKPTKLARRGDRQKGRTGRGGGGEGEAKRVEGDDDEIAGVASLCGRLRAGLPCRGPLENEGRNDG